MKKILFLSLFLLSHYLIYSQCVIYRIKGEKIICYNAEVRSNSVIYYTNATSKKALIEPKENVYKIFNYNGSKCEVTLLEKKKAKEGHLALILSGGWSGVKISDVVDPSILQNSGLRIDDIITHVDNIPIDKFSDRDDYVYGKIGDHVKLTVSRGGKAYTGTVYYYKITGVEKKDGKEVTMLDLSSVYVSSKPSSSRVSSSEDYVGAFLTFNYGIGGASFKNKEPLKFAYEFEVGYTGPNNFSHSFKFGIHEYRKEANEKMFAMNYRFMQHFGNRKRAGFLLGMDLGLLYVPNANGFFWQPGAIAGYDFHVVKHLRIGLIGTVYAIPTWNFSNVAVGGYGGVRITGLL